MSSMTPRRIRRAAERKARKEARRAEASSQNASAAPADDAAIPEIAVETEPEAQPSEIRTGPTGPRTPEGKAVSSLNNLRHGLTGAFRVVEFESQSDFDALLESLRAEHPPASATEDILVSRMAEHVWLSRRAQRLQDAALTEGDDRKFTLYLRYQTTNDRAFHKCLADLLKLRREARYAQREFESQNAKTEAQHARVRLANARAESLELETDIKTCVEAPIPGFTRIPYEDLRETFKSAMIQVAHQMRQAQAA